MGRRIGCVVAVIATVLAVVAVQGASLASGEEDDHPTGYTFAIRGRGELNGCNFFKIDLTTADMTQVNPIGQPVPCGDGLTLDDDGTLYAYRRIGPNSQLITIDKHNGSQSVVGALPPVQVGGGGMTFDEEGHLWLYAFASGDPSCANTTCLWRVDADTAHSTFVGVAPPGRTVGGLTADCEDVMAITSPPGTGPGVAGVRLDEVNTKSAALERIVDLPGVGFPTGLDFEDDGDLWAVGLAGAGAGAGIGPTLYRLDQTDGTDQAKDITIAGVPYNGFVIGLAVDPIECTEPGPTPAPAPTPTPVVVEPVFTG